MTNQTKETKLGTEPAYPAQEQAGGGDMYYGLTKRELFAAMAMQGWLAVCANSYSEFMGKGSRPQPMAESCVAFADALLQELAR